MKPEVEALVEAVALIIVQDRNDCEALKEKNYTALERAKQILSHLDIALIDRKEEQFKIECHAEDSELCTCPPVFILAEELK